MPMKPTHIEWDDLAPDAVDAILEAEAQLEDLATSLSADPHRPHDRIPDLETALRALHPIVASLNMARDQIRKQII